MSKPILLCDTAGMTNERWLECRMHGPKGDIPYTIGGSDVAAIFGVSPWTTPLELWMIKKGRMKPAKKANADQLQMGHLLEPTCPVIMSMRTPVSISTQIIPTHWQISTGGLNGTRTENLASLSAKAPQRRAFAVQSVPECPITDVDTRHETYSALLGKLSLASDHRENLLGRGLFKNHAAQKKCLLRSKR